ncbi:alpha-2-macroglobulin family protein [Luteirhabdus pelagi]|uniref:alpha-2-macroglobulin family protein n=1 Tax=Luteirhabdus pelagi TaxID=2792783 RepID=UPI001939A146|nr:MG2 domain-containing protein [Luteirhabdus pelagi]
MKATFRFFLLLTVIFFTSCDNSPDTDDTDNLFKFKDYITHHTYGIKSIADPIRIDLAQPLLQYEIAQELPSEYIDIHPKTEGMLVVENATTLLFQPKEYLQPDTEYTVTLQLKKLYESVEKEFRAYTFRFKTITPAFKVQLDNLQSYSKQWQYVTGSIETSDLISLENAKKLLSVTQNGEDLSLTMETEEGYARYFGFTIDSIQRKVEDSEIQLKWNGDPISSENKGETTFPIPGRDNFKVVDLNATHSPQASLSINFSDPLQADQDFNGLVTLENTEDLRFEVNGNVLFVYPSNRISGEVRLTLFESIKSAEGFGLKKEFSELISFEPMKPAVRLLSKGTILPDSKNTPIYFEAVNLKAVDVRVVRIYENNMLQFLQGADLNNSDWYNVKRVGRRVAKKTIDLSEAMVETNGDWKGYGLNLSEFFKTEPGALYQVEFSFKPEYIAYDCGGNETSIKEILASSEADGTAEEREERYWDNELYNWRNYTYNWEEEGNPCHPAYYNQERFVTTNVLGSDLGLIVKKGKNNSYHFATTNLLSAKPERGTKIRLYNYQQQLIETVTTDSEGMTLYDSEKTVSFAVAQKGDNYAYAKLADGNALSLSKFDVSGKELQKGLKGFLYTERGVHRPGDSIHLTFVLNDKANPLPKNHPVTLHLTDPRGKLLEKQVLKSGPQVKNNFYYFPLKTTQNSPTGNYLATVSVGGVQFTKTLRVATVKPNRLKIKLNFDDEVLSSKKPIAGNASSTWLHGAPARNLKMEMDVTLRSTQTAFKDWPKYDFTDPVRTFDEVELPILEQQLSSDGNLDFSKQLQLSDKAPGMLQATFLTKVYEGGGDFSLDVFSKNLAPYSHFVGLRSPEPHRYGSYNTDQNTEFDVVSVDEKGKAAANRTLQVKIFKIEWRWWWNRGRDNLSRYENATVHRPVQNITVTTNAQGKGSFNLNIPEEEGGRYLIRVVDESSGHATGRVTYFYRNWWKAPTDGDAESSKMLVFSADKESYKVGEEAFITFPSSSNGRALISIENGTEVLATHWIETNKGETKAAVRLTEDMAPNIYVNISLLQPHEQTMNDHPIRLYGVIPLKVENPKTILHPTIDMPTVLKPEESFKVTVSEKNNRTMTYTLAVVDEGLLDLTRFQTPKIHEAFYSREALGVKTFDIFDDVIGAHSGSVSNIYAIGGGDAAAGAKNKKADRFKPVVKYLGPFQLDAGKKATHRIQMPNYIGSVRTMVVAGNASDGAYGAVEETTPVRKPLMVLASVPRKLSPGEKVTIPVTVFAMESKVKNASINLKVSDALKPLEGTTKSISFSEIGEKIVNFEFEVLPSEDIQTIEVMASGSGETARYALEIDVENPNPITQRTKTYTLTENGSETITFETFGVAGTNSASLEFSTLPPMNFNKRMEYLIRYPHGCVEQTTSAAFPQLYLADVFDITYDKKQEIQKNVEAAIRKLGNYQNTSGGMSYWPGERYVDDWSTSYVGHFMLEAKEKGYALPITFLSNWLQYQKKAAREWRNSQTSYNSSHTQAYRLYTLALAGQPELAAMNRLRESKYINNEAKWRLAAAYALAGKASVAKDLASSANIYFEPKPYQRYTYGSPFRNKAMALETMVILEDPEQRELALSLAKELSSQRWFSTQETAYGLMAMARMVNKNGGKAMTVTFRKNGKTEELKTDRAIALRELGIQMGNNTVEVTNKKDNTVYVTLSQQGKLPLGEELVEARNLELRVRYFDGEGKTMDVSTLRQGTEINAEITVTNTSGSYIDNVALTQIFPSGWEIVNTSFTELGGGAEGNARYKDIRDDRVQYYFDLRAKKSKTFTAKLNASYLGTYYLPGAQVDAMYDNTYYARNKGKWITVQQ